MGPLAEEAIGGESRPRRLEELPREERRDAGHPGIGRLGNNHVVLPRCQQQVGTAVANDEPNRRVGEDVPALAIEEMRRRHDFGRDLDNVGVTDLSWGQRGAQRHPAAESDDADFPCLPMKRDGQQPEQALSQHVAAIRGVDLAVDR